MSFINITASIERRQEGREMMSLATIREEDLELMIRSLEDFYQQNELLKQETEAGRKNVVIIYSVIRILQDVNEKGAGVFIDGSSIDSKMQAIITVLQTRDVHGLQNLHSSISALGMNESNNEGLNDSMEQGENNNHVNNDRVNNNLTNQGVNGWIPEDKLDEYLSGLSEEDFLSFGEHMFNDDD